MKTPQIKHTLNEAIEKLEQAKERIGDLILESEENAEDDNYEFIEKLNDYTEDIQSVIDKISDDNELNEDEIEDSESSYLKARDIADKREQTEW